MTKFLTSVVGRLPRPCRKYAKAFIPALVAGAVAVQDLTVSAVEVNEIKALAVGAVASLLVGVTPNVH